MRIPRKLPTKYVLPLLLVSIIGTAAAVTMLFTHTFPAIPIITPPPLTALVTSCSTLTPSVTSVAGLTSADVFFNCGTLNGLAVAAFSTVSTNGVPVTVTPTFILPSSYTHLYIVQFFETHSGTCLSQALIELISGVPIITNAPVTIGVSLDYCATYAAESSGSLSTFTVDWTQTP